mgnify:CR=1 FL=1
MKQRDEYIVDESEILKDYKYLKEELQRTWIYHPKCNFRW